MVATSPAMNVWTLPRHGVSSHGGFHSQASGQDPSLGTSQWTVKQKGRPTWPSCKCAFRDASRAREASRNLLRQAGIGLFKALGVSSSGYMAGYKQEDSSITPRYVLYLYLYSDVDSWLVLTQAAVNRSSDHTEPSLPSTRSPGRPMVYEHT
jgi:hypothetical protein